MSILKSKPRLVRAVHWAFALLAISLMGCVLFESLDPGIKPFAFSHKLHVGEQGLECAACHRNWEKADDPGMPSAKQCALCHEDADSTKPPDRQVASMFDGKRYKSLRVMALDEEIVFSHKSHATRGSDCAVCHADVAENEVLTADLAVSMDSCTNCHAQTSGSNECAVCHKEIRAELAPPNHRMDWKRNHGASVRECSRATADRCELCHTESSCTSCHQTELPASHNGFWRRRGHGLAAGRDRESCATCHAPTTCESCHQETPPLSHRAGFGSPMSRHCVDCHEPLANEGCGVCHKSAPSHALANPKPPGHSAAMDCRMCHGNGQPLPHFDNGSDCNACHL